MNYIVLLKCGLMLLAFFIPLIAYSFFMDFYYVSLMAVAKEEVEQTKNVYFYFLYSGIIVLSLPVIVSISGINHILRNFIWGEGIYFASDFASGVKQNALKNIIFGFILGVILFASYFVTTLFSGLFVIYLPLIFSALIFVPIYFWILYLNNTYNSKWTVLVRNGFYFFIKNLGWSLLGILMPLSLFALMFIPFSLIWIKYIILVLFIVFVFPIIFLIMELFATSKFDEAINREYYPVYYLKGLNH